MAQLHIILSILSTLSWATEVVTAPPPVDIYWNRTNHIFERNNNEHIVEVRIKEQIRFLCPYYETPQDNMEHYIIYRVPKEYYDSCHLPVNANEDQLRSEYNIEKVHNCSMPNSHSVFLSYVDTFYALPGRYGGLTYETGQEYYFTSISTGSLSGLHNRLSEPSACKQYNMKAIVRVCCNQNDTFTCPLEAIKCNMSVTDFTDPPLVTVDPNAPPTTRPTTTPTTTTTVSWTTVRSQITTKSQQKTTVKGTGTEEQVGDNSAHQTVAALSSSLLLLSLIVGLTGLDLT